MADHVDNSSAGIFGDRYFPGRVHLKLGRGLIRDQVELVFDLLLAPVRSNLAVDSAMFMFAG